MHTYIHMCIHTYTCAYVHTNTHSHVHTCIRTFTCAYVHTYIHTYIHMCIRTYTYTCAYTDTYIHICIHIFIHTYIYIYACIHVYMYVYNIKTEKKHAPLRHTHATNRADNGAIVIPPSLYTFNQYGSLLFYVPCS